jgi:hypothetical protein
MVSVGGYVLAEYIVAIALSYALFFLTGFSEYIIDYARDKEWWKSVGIYSGLVFAGMLLYTFDVRIGVVWMVNGMLIMRLAVNVVNIVAGMNDGDERTIEQG